MDIPSIQPLLPRTEKCVHLKNQALEVDESSRVLTEGLPAKSLQAVEDLLKIVNSYYSNLIEGILFTQEILSDQHIMIMTPTAQR